MRMEMYLYFTCKCEFIFETWRTHDDDHFLFAVGCFLSLLYSFFHFFLLNSESKLYGLSNLDAFMSERLFYGLYHTILSLSSIILMMLIMTMNVWVNISCALGLTLAYALTESKKQTKVQIN
ncbi:hypothetical protein pb186bvf_004248 [Paramecium bursaria]